MIGTLELINWMSLFDLVNEDIKNGEIDGQVVPLTDVDYYTEQIHNLTNEENWPRANRIAKMMADRVKWEESNEA